MNDEQKQRALQIWHDYLLVKDHLLSKNGEYNLYELDKKRMETNSEFSFLLNAYISGHLKLAQFKTKLDSTHKRIRVWGFQSFNGQMFFNRLVNASRLASTWDELDELLKSSLPLPASLDPASAVMNNVVEFVNSLSTKLPHSRAVPGAGAVPFFLSYFWHIQSPQSYPIYYEATVRVLRESDFWQPEESLGENYLSFFGINHELVELFSRETGKPQNLWEVEHAFWNVSLGDQPQVDVESKAPHEVPREPGIGKWDQCLCPACDKRLLGFDLDKHTQSIHKGIEPGYQKLGK
jgi:hypothetical protein